MKYKIIEFKKKKTLKEVYFADDSYPSYMDLDSIFNMMPDDVNYGDSTFNGKLFGVISPDTNFLNIFRFRDINAKVSNPEDLSNSEYLFSINTKFYNDTKTQIDDKLRSVTKAFKKAQNQDTNISKSFCHAFFGMLRERFMSLIFKSESETSVKYLLNDIIKNPENYVFDFQQRFDEYFDISMTSNVNKDKFVIHLKHADPSFDNKRIEIKQKLVYNVLEKDTTTNSGGYGNFNSDINFSDILSEFSKKLIEQNGVNDLLNTNITKSDDSKEYNMQVISTIINTYSDVDPNYIISQIERFENVPIRNTFESENDLLTALNKSEFDFLRSLKQKGGGQGDAKGKGEAIVHLLANTKNVCTRIEPDAIIQFTNDVKKFSIKSMSSGSAQTGTRLPQNIPSRYSAFIKTLITDNIPAGVSINSSFIYAIMFKALNKEGSSDSISAQLAEFNERIGHGTLSESIIDKIVNQYNKIENVVKADIDVNDVKSKYLSFKKEILKEHDPDFCLIHKDEKFELINLRKEGLDSKTIIKSIGSDNRISFMAGEECASKCVFSGNGHNFGNKIFNNTKNPSEFESALHYLVEKIKNSVQDTEDEGHPLDLSDSEEDSSESEPESDGLPDDSDFEPVSVNQESFLVKGKLLKEVYSHLFDLKKTINEGALGGHMMHPYEALDMTPELLASRIKQYGVPQKIIEKVDGQNLFFTVETDGTLLFARNKEDMTHDDLIEKFTGHPAEKPFIEGGNAIKAGVESLLNNASQEEVIRLFHPSEGIRTFVNFEIMHPEKPNQIIYDEKYIVFHGIVDYRNGREEAGRSNQDQRIQELVSLMSSGVSSAGFTLASNREVDLNQLTDIQIAEYTQKIYDISEALGLEEGETLGDGIMNVIGDEIEAEGVSLSDEALTIFTDYIIRGEDSEGRSIASREWTKLLSKEDVVKLRQLGLTSTAKVKTKIGQILQPFKALFVELGIDLLKGVQSSYMSADMNIENVELIRDKLSTAISDLESYISTTPEKEWPNNIKSLIPHMELINRKGIDNIVSSAVEGGVYSTNDSLFKVTGGFAPMNQIIGAAYRDKENIFTTFKEKYKKQESKTSSLKNIYKLLF